LLLVIGRFGVSLGFGDKTINEVCRAYHLNPSLVLLVLNVFNSHTYSVAHLLSEESIPELIQYLKNGHQYFLTEKLPNINSLIDKFIEKNENPDSPLLRNFLRNIPMRWLNTCAWRSVPFSRMFLGY
jgi:regulator of cell morphogenesis and NO signaling